MRLTSLAATALALAATAGLAPADPITLEQAVSRAARRPGVEMAGADVLAAQGLTAGARRPLYNPQLGVAAGPRFAADRTGFEVSVSLAQTIELGGKRGARAAAAAARGRAAEAELAVALREADLETRRAFQLALVARERVIAARDAEALAAQMETATRDRLTLGAGTQLQVNLATVEVGRARHDRVDVENQYETALAAIATAVGAGPEERLEPSGELITPPVARWTEDDLVQRAIARRPELVQAQSARDAAGADVTLADALARPDVTLGVSYGLEREAAANTHIALLSASIGVPVRNQNQGERSASRSRLRRAEIDLRRQRDEVVREARLALQSYLRARDAVLGFDQQINERLHDNLELARESFASGKIDYFEFNVVRRELLASRTAYLDAVSEAVDAWHALVRAAGEEQTP